MVYLGELGNEFCVGCGRAVHEGPCANEGVRGFWMGSEYGPVHIIGDPDMGQPTKDALKEVMEAAYRQLTQVPSECNHFQADHTQNVLQVFGWGSYRFYLMQCTGCREVYVNVKGDNGYPLGGQRVRIVKFDQEGKDTCYHWRTSGQSFYSAPMSDLPLMGCDE